jgi:glycosyltransferase involved in cell wall biosynthesis
MNMLISAIICTHNRPKFLETAIQSLVDQPLPVDQFEVIVVDNCSANDSTKQVVDKFLPYTNVRYIYEPTLGLSYARNTGWRAARGKYAAYLDDDAVACSGWLQKIIETFESVQPRPGCVGGKAIPIWEGARPPWLSDWLLHGLTLLNWTDTPHRIEDIRTEWLVGANIAFQVDLLQHLGGFTSKLDRVGTNLLSSGDVFLEKQIMKEGFTCHYQPEISIGHHITQSRLTQAWFTRRYYWQGVSDSVMEMLEVAPSRLKRYLLATRRAGRLLRSPGKLVDLVLAGNHPDRFTTKCFTLIELGHIMGLLGQGRGYDDNQY